MRKSEKRKRRNARRSSQQHNRRRLMVETLESRMLLAGCVSEGGQSTQLTIPADDAAGLYFHCGNGTIDPPAEGSSESDTDTWSFDAQADDLVSIRVGSTDGKIDPYVTLYDGNSNELTTDRNSGPGLDAFISSHWIPSSGTYTIQVGDSSNTVDPGAYEVHIDVARGIGLEQDSIFLNDSVPNDLPFTDSGTPRTASVAGTVMAVEKDDTDEDGFKLEPLYVGDSVELQINIPESSPLVPRLRVVDRKDRTNVLSDEDGKPYDGHFYAEVRSDGDYYAEVSGFWTWEDSRYLPILSPTTWAEADALATAEGGHLAAADLVTTDPESGEIQDVENQWLADTFAGHGTVFLGLEYQLSGTSGAWIWSSGEAVTYDKWTTKYDQFRTDAEDHHGALSTFEGTRKWYSFGEDEKRFAVAEFPRQTTDPSETEPGPWSRYVLDVAIREVVPPVITGVDAFPGAGETTDAIISSFEVAVSEDLYAETANTATNWALRSAGENGQFDDGDDVIYQLALSSTYVDGQSVQLSVTNGPLDEGRYRFTAAASLLDTSKNELDGNGDQVGGDPYQHEFSVQFSELVTFEGRDNGTKLKATSLPLNENPVGSGFRQGFGAGAIDPTADVDWWSFDASTGDRIAIAVDPQVGALRPGIELYNEAGEPQLEGRGELEGPGSGAYVSHVPITAGGTYYLRVECDGGSGGQYQLRVESARGIDLESDEDYANNTTAEDLTFQAFGGETRTTVAGTVMAPDGAELDVDQFFLGDLSSDDEIKLQVRLPSTSTLVPYIRVFDGDGNALADTDGDLTDGHFRAPVPADGQYFAELSGFWTHSWMRDGEREYSRYLPTSNVSSRKDAQDLAEELGGNLVTVNDQAEDQWLAEQFIQMGSLWLGLYDNGGEDWIWTSDETTSDETSSSYRNWGPATTFNGSAEPNSDADRNGVVMSDFFNDTPYWYDIAETNPRLGILEIPGSPDDVADAAPGSRAQYLLDVIISDVVSPIITGIDRLPVEGGQTDEIISAFKVTTSERLDPGTVNKLDNENKTSNWILVEAGEDEIFGNDDDTKYTLAIDPAYTEGTEVAISVVDGPLSAGHYRFTATGSLTDLSGNPLDDGAYERTFYVDFPEPFIFEGTDNNIKENATALPLTEDPTGSGYHLGFGIGSIDPLNDIDWWSFQAKAGDLVSIAVDPQAGVLQPQIELHSTNGLLPDNQFGGDGPGKAAYISRYEITADGTYYVRAARQGGDIDTYRLRVELGRGVDLESDARYSNNSRSTANSLVMNASNGKKTAAVGGTIMASEGATRDIDLFDLGPFVAGNELELQVSLPTHSTVVPHLRVLDADLNPLDDDGDSNDGHFTAVIPSDGSYYAQVASYWTRAGHRYLPTAEKVTWSEAENMALSLGGHLVTVGSGEEDQWLADNFLSLDSIWLGLNDVLNEGDWQWSSGESVNYTNWLPDDKEPNGGTIDNGVVLSNFSGTPHWYDIRSTYDRFGVAELAAQASDPVDGGPGTLAQYVLKATVFDSIYPQISEVSRLPDEGGTTDDVFRSFRVTASEEMDGATTTNAANWKLREAGPDGQFDTTDDGVYSLSPFAVTGDGSAVDLVIHGVPLDEGHYRFTASAALTDDFGNPLDGDGDGMSGDAYQRTFYVEYPESHVLESANNDTLETATALRLREDPFASGYHVGRGFGSIDPATDEDWWSFPARDGDLVAVALDPESDELVAGVELYDANGNLLKADAEGIAGPDQAAYISNYPITADGTYYARAAHVSGVPGLYQLRVEFARGIDLESDADYANNSFNGADSITWSERDGAFVGRVGGTIMGDRGNTSDQDVYSLGTLAADDHVVANVRLPRTSHLTPVVEIQDSNGTVVSTSPNPYIIAAAADVTATGKYYAVVRGSDGAGPRGQYVMDVLHEPLALDTKGYADLVVTELTVPSTARGGQTIPVKWTVANRGSAATRSTVWSDRVFLSTNEVLGDGDDIAALTSAIHSRALDVDGTYKSQSMVKLPFLDEAAEYHVFVVIDQNDDVEEQIFEYNNTAQGDAALKLPAPMRVVDLIDVSPDPRNSPVAEVEVVFSEPIDPSSLTGDDLTLERNNLLIAVDVPLTVTEVGENRYRISGLESLTAAGGEYNLTIDASGILIPEEVPGKGTASDSWLTDVTPPYSSVDSLPKYATSLDFEITISGVDLAQELGGTSAGLNYYDVYVSVNYAPFEFWRSVSAEDPRVTFSAESSSIYHFRSVAFDKAGNMEDELLRVDAETVVLDLDVPQTEVTNVETSSSTFQLDVQGGDVGGTLDFFGLYVEIDGSVIHHFATLPAGEPDAEGVYHGSIEYQAIADGEEHDYRFYSVGQDLSGNREDAAAGQSDILVSKLRFDPPSSLTITGLDVQDGANQRSFIRYVDVLFSSKDQLDDLLASTTGDDARIRLVDLGMDGTASNAPLNLEGVARVSGLSLKFDFGSQGIGGNRNSAAGNGYYELAFDLNDDGQFTDDEILHFFRLFGDTNGDRLVDRVDYYAVRSAYGSRGLNLDEDINGDGQVNSYDSRYLRRQIGMEIPAGLEIDD